MNLTNGQAIDCDYCLNSWVEGGSELGHQHDPQLTSKIFYARGSIWSDPQPPAELFTSTGFSFRTGPRQPLVAFTAPEAAASVRVSTWARLAERNSVFFCQPYDRWAHATCTDASRQEAYFDFLLDFLPPRPSWAELPESSNYLRCDYFSKCRATGQDSQGHPPHGSNMWGEAEFLTLLQKLAVAFRNYKDRDTGQQPFKHDKLMIGDISLKDGGVFDLNKNWSPSHCRHRVGRSADISRYVWNEQTGTYRELSANERRTFVTKVCGQFENLSCSLHPRGTAAQHVHVEYLTSVKGGPLQMWPIKTSNMPCPWPSPRTFDDICPIIAPLPQ